MTMTYDIKPITSDAPEAVEVRSGLAQMEQQALLLAIVDDETSGVATDMLKQLREARKNVEERLKSITAPLKAADKSARDTFNPFIDKYKAIEENLRERNTVYLQAKVREEEERKAKEQREAEEKALAAAAEQERQAREQREAIEAQAKAQADALREQGNAEAAAAVEENAAKAAEFIAQGQQNDLNQVVNVADRAGGKVERSLKSASGATASLQKVWDFEVVDVSQLLAEFLLPNTSAIREFMRSKVREQANPVLSGVRFFQKDQLAVR